MSTTLTAAQQANYQDDGFLFPLRVMDAQTASEMRAEIEALEARFGADRLRRPVSSYLRANAHVVSHLVQRLASWPAILDAVEGILGPDILVWSSDLFIKEPVSDKIVSWHQDLTYWGLGATGGQVTAWLALSDVNEASGCMRFVAGSHKNAIVPHRDTFAANNLLSRGQEIAVDVDENDAVLVELAPGEMSLHHGLMFHASGPNVSNNRRIGMAIRFIRPDVKQQVAERDYAMLVRGVDRHHHFTLVAPPSTEFSADSQALYEVIIADQAQALSQGAAQEIAPELSGAAGC